MANDSLKTGLGEVFTELDVDKMRAFFRQKNKTTHSKLTTVEEAVKAVNLRAMLDGDLQEKLRQRSKRKRFAPEASDEDKKERLKNLQKELDIPQDVIDSLSPKECPNSDFCDKDCQKENGVD